MVKLVPKNRDPQKPRRRLKTLSKRIKRYTSLSSALHTLSKKEIVLLSPKKWDDTNDSYFMELYRIQKNYGSLLALCCTRTTETYHHWRVFTPEQEGICLEFHREPLEAALRREKNVQADLVKYVAVEDLEKYAAKDVDKMPFIKRLGYEDEREWRIIGHTVEALVETLPLSIEISWINRLVVNPWMPPDLVENLREMIHEIVGCEKMRVEPSRVTNSVRWKAAGRKLCARC